MPDLVTYDRATGAVTGYVRSSSDDITILPRSDAEGLAPVTDEKSLAVLADAAPGDVRLVGRVAGGELTSLRVEPRHRGVISLTCGASDLDGDGRAEVPADARSRVTITATVLGPDGEPDPAADVEVAFRTTRGALSARRARVSEGRAEVSLRAVSETTAVRVVAQADGYAEGTLDLELIPAAEHRELVAAHEQDPE